MSPEPLQCWCCAFYGLLRPAARNGLCAFCLVLSGTCEHGHRMAARYEAAGDD